MIADNLRTWPPGVFLQPDVEQNAAIEAEIATLGDDGPWTPPKRLNGGWAWSGFTPAAKSCEPSKNSEVPMTQESSNSLNSPMTDRCAWCGQQDAPLRTPTPDGGRYLCESCYSQWLSENALTQTTEWGSVPRNTIRQLIGGADPEQKLANGYSMADVARAIEDSYSYLKQLLPNVNATTDLFEEHRDLTSPGWRTKKDDE